MKPCRKLDEYLDGQLADSEVKDFETHAERCPACGARVEQWRRASEGLRQWAKKVEYPVADRTKARKLLRRAESTEAGPGRPFRVRLAWVAAGCVVVGLGLWIALTARRYQASLPVPSHKSVHSREKHQRSPARWRLLSAANGPSALKLGRTRMAVAVGTVARVRYDGKTDTRLRLELGSVAVEVDPGGTEPPFVVEAGAFEVRVLGTWFMATLTGAGVLRVAVSRGKVAVTGPGGEYMTILTGQTLEWAPGERPSITPIDPKQQGLLQTLLEIPESDGSRKASVEPVKVPSTGPVGRRTAQAAPGARRVLEQCRNLVYVGQLKEAERLLAGYLRRHSKDSRAWSLLGDCRRKAGKWRGAVKAYRRVISLGPSAPANRARYMAATILQDRLKRHDRALALLKAYLAHDRGRRPLTAEALLRQARALLSLGRGKQARKCLMRILRRHGGTTAAIRARRLLGRMKKNPRRTKKIPPRLQGSARPVTLRE